jgi:hypothetical protein
MLQINRLQRKKTKKTGKTQKKVQNISADTPIFLQKRADFGRLDWIKRGARRRG